MNVILSDYLSGILGTFRDCSTWCLTPLEEIREAGKTKVKRAEGNAISVEFNLLYRVGNSDGRFSPSLSLFFFVRLTSNNPLCFLLLQWHATLSTNDDNWLNSTLRRNLPADHPAQNNPDYEWTKRDYGIASANAIDRHGTDPRGWSFGKCASCCLLLVFFGC